MKYDSDIHGFYKYLGSWKKKTFILIWHVGRTECYKILSFGAELTCHDLRRLID